MPPMGACGREPLGVRRPSISGDGPPAPSRLPHALPSAGLPPAANVARSQSRVVVWLEVARVERACGCFRRNRHPHGYTPRRGPQACTSPSVLHSRVPGLDVSQPAPFQATNEGHRYHSQALILEAAGVEPASGIFRYLRWLLRGRPRRASSFRGLIGWLCPFPILPSAVS